MSRKPITTMAGGKGPRQKIWEAIRARHEDWTRYDIARAADVEDGTVCTYMQALEKAQIIAVTRIEPVNNVSAIRYYRLLRNEGIEAPRLRRNGTRVTQGLAQEQMWRALRVLRTDINWRELAAHATTPDVPVDPAAAKAYLCALHIAGYVAMVKDGQGKGRPGTGILARYRLKPSMNTGPRPPMICRTKVVYDANLGKVVWAPTITDEDAIYEQA